MNFLYSYELKISTRFKNPNIILLKTSTTNRFCKYEQLHLKYLIPEFKIIK